MKDDREPRVTPTEIEIKKPYEKPSLIDLGNVAVLSRFDVSVNA